MTISCQSWPTREWMIPAKVKIIFAFTKMILTFAGPRGVRVQRSGMWGVTRLRCSRRPCDPRRICTCDYKVGAPLERTLLASAWLCSLMIDSDLGFGASHRQGES